MSQEQEGSFTSVAREQLPWLYALARQLVGEDAEDAVQECLLKAYRGYDRLRDRKAAPAWFRQILLNCVRDRYRRQAGLPREDPRDPTEEYSLYRTIAEQDPWPYSDSVHLDFLRCFEHDDVWQVLDRVKPLYRAPLVLVHMEGMSTNQVARMFGVAQGTVLSWLHRGRKLFEEALWEYANEHDLLVESPGGSR
ncbi:MAG: RNA polymerase sigma factor [Egibacteraceae bacterium]